MGETWWGRFEDQVVEPAFAGGPLRYQVRDWEGDEFGMGLAGWRSEPARGVVIIEGVGSARASIRERGAFTVWVDASEELRLERGIARDGETHRHLWQAWMATERDHFARDRTRELADLLVDGNPNALDDPTTQLVILQRGTSQSSGKTRP